MVGVTGVITVQVEQGRLVRERFKRVEIGSLAAVALILAITVRSLVAPLITLATAVVAYLLAVRVIGAASTDVGAIAPSQIQPLIVALTLGLATDYSIFFLAGMRRRVLLGCSPRAALRASVTHNAPIVLVAGLTVAAGVASVSVAKLSLFRVFGPGLAMLVVIALLVSMTLVPALLAILGRLALWPGAGRGRDSAADERPTRGEQFARLLTHRGVALLQRSGLGKAHVRFTGAWSLGAEFVSTARADLIRVAVAVAAVNLVLLMLFLRAVVAPIYLLACSFLSVGAALGLTTLVFQGAIGQQGLIFYAPFAAGVLLASLGSDYNIFTVGRIWDETRSLPLREALVAAVPRSARPVNVAAVALAASFACVALIPVAPFRELAFAVAVGVLVDAFLVRSLLVPALIVLFGKFSGWRGRRLIAAAELRHGGAD